MTAKSWVPGWFFCVMAILISTLLCGCGGNKTTKVEAQHIYEVMQPAPIGGQSTADYTRVLQGGGEVNGNVNVSGEWEVPADSCSPWTYEAWNPAGVLIGTSTVAPNIVDDNPYIYFNFNTTIGGKYMIRIIHYSTLVRYLNMVISPPGWQYEAPAT